MHVIHVNHFLEVLITFRWWPSLAETCKGLILLLKILLHLMEFNPNFTWRHIDEWLYYKTAFGHSMGYIYVLCVMLGANEETHTRTDSMQLTENVNTVNIKRHRWCESYATLLTIVSAHGGTKGCYRTNATQRIPKTLRIEGTISLSNFIAQSV
jgi:hypothetical protein